MAGRKNDLTKFYNFPDQAKALAAADLRWPKLRRISGNIKDFTKKSGVQNSQWVIGRDGGRVGVRVMVFALLVTYRFGNDTIVRVSDLKSDNLDDFKWAEGRGCGGVDSRKLRDMVTAVIKTTGEDQAAYDAAYDKLCFTHVAMMARRALHKRCDQEAPSFDDMAAEVEALYDDIVAARCQSVRQVFAILEREWLEGLTYTPVAKVPASGAKSRPKGLDLNHIPDGYRNYLMPNGRYRAKENPVTMERMAKRMRDELMKSTPAPRVVLLTGRPNAGKSGVLVEVLRKLHLDSIDTLGLALGEDPETAQILPVFLMNVPACDYTEMALRLLAFLRRQDRAARGGSDLPDFEVILSQLTNHHIGDDGNTDLEPVLAEIKRLHGQNPAVFVLTNWEDLTWSTNRAQLRDQANASLIRLLYDSNISTKSRIVVSTTSRLSDAAKQRLPTTREFNVEDPALDDITRYFPDLTVPVIYQDALEKATDSMNGKSVQGDTLILLASVLELCEGDPKWEARIKEEIDHLSNPDCQFKGSDHLVKLLLDRLEDRKLLRPVLAIAASDDGLRLSSLKKVLRDWDRDCEMTPERPASAILKALTEELRPCAGGFFIKSRPTPIRNSAQFSPPMKGIEKEESWEMHQTLRLRILSVLSDPAHAGWAKRYRELLQQASGQVAALVHFRAQEWRSQTRLGNLTPRWQDLLLDSQAVEALLASIDPAGLDNSDLNRRYLSAEPLLHQATDKVFAPKPKQMASVALRFAAHVILRDTLDWNRRMTMCFDQDQLRARLYLLLFQPLGQRHFQRIDEIGAQEFPTTLPAYLTDVFTPAEILSLLEALAISSFHAQAPRAVVWAWEMALDLINGIAPRPASRVTTPKREALLAQAARIYCSVVDMSILLGQPATRTGRKSGGSNHSATLKLLRSVLELEFGEIEKALEQSPAAISALTKTEDGPNPDMVRAWLRLKAREAELVSLTLTIKDALALYDLLFEVEEDLARQGGAPQSVITAGRPSRTVLRLSLRAEAQRRQAGASRKGNWRQKDRRIRGILHSNIGRLTQFGGAEQVALLIDRSRFHAVTLDRQEDALRAVSYASQARKLCGLGQISYGMQMQALMHFVAIVIEATSPDAPQGRFEAKMFGVTSMTEVLQMANLDIEAVLNTADRLKFKPKAAIARYLRARVHLLLSEQPGVQMPDGWENDAISQVQKAQEQMRAAHDISFKHEMQEALEGLVLKNNPVDDPAPATEASLPLVDS